MTTHTNTAAPADLPDLVIFTAGRVRQARMAALEPHGLSPHQGRAFYVIAHQGHHREHGELRPSDLARRLRITPRSATEVIDALCELGLVQRRPSASDRRSTCLLLTSAGEALREQLHSQPDGATEVFAALSDAERAELTALLRKVLASGA